MSKPYPYMIPSEKQFADYMKYRGIKLSSRVVVYDTKPGMMYYSTKAYYMFRTFGHKGVSLLNGGMSKWIAEGRPTESYKDVGNENNYDYKLDKNLLKEYDEMLQFEKKFNEKNCDVQILDARPS